MSKKIIRTIIILIFILLLISLILYILLLNMNNKESINGEYEPENVEFEPLYKETIEPVDNSITFIEMVKINNCVQNYLDIINKNNSSYYGKDEDGNYVKIIEEEEIKTEIFNLLDLQYIEENNIKINNVYSFVDNIDEKVIFNVVDVKNTNIENKYLAYGIIQNLENKLIKRAYFIVNIQDNSFSIQPILENRVENINVKKTNVEPNEYNEIIPVNISQTQDIVKFYFNLYKNILIASSNDAFEKLDTKYKKEKFEDKLEQFEEYTKKRQDTLKKAILSKYSEKINGSTTRYTCLDQFDNYYIIEVKGNSKYNIILDLYTLETPEFLEAYNSAKDYEKVGLNIQNAFMALNDGDYKYVYNKLDETFKNNNYKTQTDFEKYIKSQLFTNNQVTYKKYEQSGNIYIYTLEITDKDRKESRKVDMQVVMALGEGTDFTMSFSIN